MLLQRVSSGLRGFTLVEVMVTLFIIAIGLLGVAGLQLASIRSNQSALLRSQATLAAYALADRMRVDPAKFTGLRIDSDRPGGNESFSAWATELMRSLPPPAEQPLAELDCTAGNACNDGHCAITIRWNDARGEVPALAQDGRDARAIMFRTCTRLPE
jgi:type IV pilus assembly protein PilV